MEITVGIIFADEMEYAPFLNLIKEKEIKQQRKFGNDTVEFTLFENERKIRVVAVKCGIGKTNAAASASYLITAEGANVILNAGLSGAVQKLRREDVVAAESYIECDFDLTAIGYAPGVKADKQNYLYRADKRLLSVASSFKGVKTGKTGTGDLFLADKERKNYFKETFGIDSFDMETAAIASVCDKCGVPFLSLRKISDDADDCSVSDYREMNERQELCLSELLLKLLSAVAEDDSFFA